MFTMHTSHKRYQISSFRLSASIGSRLNHKTSQENMKYSMLALKWKSECHCRLWPHVGDSLVLFWNRLCHYAIPNAIRTSETADPPKSFTLRIGNYQTVLCVSLLTRLRTARGIPSVPGDIHTMLEKRKQKQVAGCVWECSSTVFVRYA